MNRRDALLNMVKIVGAGVLGAALPVEALAKEVWEIGDDLLVVEQRYTGPITIPIEDAQGLINTFSDLVTKKYLKAYSFIIDRNLVTVRWQLAEQRTLTRAS